MPFGEDIELKDSQAVDDAWNEAFSGEDDFEVSNTTDNVQSDSSEVKNESEETGDKTEGGEQTKGDTEIEIDQNLVLLAKDSGANVEALDQLIKEDPAEAQKFLTDLSNTVTQQTFETLRGLRYGGDQRASETNVDPLPVSPTSQTTKQGESEPELSPLEKFFTDEKAVEEFKEEHGEGLLKLMKSQADHAKSLREANKSEISFVKDLREQLIASQQQTLITEINQVFDSFKGFEEFYGKGDNSALSPEQIENRAKVGDIVDALKAHDAALSRPILPNRSYMIKAHQAVSAEYAHIATRKALLEKLEKRREGFVNPPSQGSKKALTINEKSEEAALNAVSVWQAEGGHDNLFDD